MIHDSNIRMKGLVATLLALVLPVTACSGADAPQGGQTVDDQVPETGIGPQTAYEVAEWLGMGWNLGNQMDAHAGGVASETCWGNPETAQAAFDKVKAAGFSSVRIPVTWLGHVGPAPDYEIDGAWLDRVEEIVGYAERAGLKAIINIHHDGADSAHWLSIKAAAEDESANETIMARIAAMWTQIALRFKDKGDFLIFEAFNEIHDGGWGWGANRTDGGKQYRCLAQWNQTFVDAVRDAGGCNTDRYLAVPGYCTNPELTVEYLELPEDSVRDRLLVSVHYYDPSEYTLTAKYSEWGHTSSPGTSAGENEEEHAVEIFSKLNSAFVSKGIPVYLGEIGCVNRENPREQAFQRYWFEYVVKAARTFGLAAFVWDNGAGGTGNEQHGFIDHATGDFKSDPARLAVETMIKAMNSDEPGYTLDTVYENAPE